MKVIINGREKELKILYGRRAVFTYDSVVDMADKHPLATYSVTYSCSDVQGSLTEGQRVEFGVDEIPVFNVHETSNA